MCCTDPKTGAVIGNICSCMMCKRLVLNAGIEKVVVREEGGAHTTFKTIDWVYNDDSLSGKFGY